MKLEELQGLLRKKEADIEELEYKNYQMRMELEEEFYQLQSKTLKIREMLEEKHNMARQFLFREEDAGEITKELQHRLNRQFESWTVVLDDSYNQAKLDLNRKQENLDAEFRQRFRELQAEVDDLNLQKRRLL